MNLPKISIVTPSFNQGQYIEQTIRSVLDQGYPNLEYIIIDGGSTDNTVEIIKKYADRISYWVSEPDKGQSDALNKGLAKCTGDIFNWINSDDWLEPGALEKVAEAFSVNDADIICGYSRIFKDTNGEEMMKHRSELFNDTEATLVRQRINQPGMFYKFPVIRDLGGINSNLHYSMDLELWFKYLCSKGQSKIKLTDHLLAHFRIHDQSKTGVDEQKFREEEKAVWYYLLTSLKVDKAWSSFFAGEKTYQPLIPWDLRAINTRDLLTNIAERYLDAAYKTGHKAFCKKAYRALYKNGKLSFNLQHIAMFVKIFIGNIPFRRFFKNHA